MNVGGALLRLTCLTYHPFVYRSSFVDTLHVTQSFFTRFHSNFICGLLLSNSRQSSNVDFVRSNGRRLWV